MIWKRTFLALAMIGVTLTLVAVTGEIVTRVWLLNIPPPGFVIHPGERPFFQMASSVPYLTLSHFRIRQPVGIRGARPKRVGFIGDSVRSEEHTSELQSQFHLVCRLLLEKNK